MISPVHIIIITASIPNVSSSYKKWFTIIITFVAHEINSIITEIPNSGTRYNTHKLLLFRTESGIIGLRQFLGKNYYEHITNRRTLPRPTLEKASRLKCGNVGVGMFYISVI